MVINTIEIVEVLYSYFSTITLKVHFSSVGLRFFANISILVTNDF